MRMKTRLTFGVILAILLSSLLPGAALMAKPATKPFNATGSVTYITPGTVYQAGATGKWVVLERTIGGNVAGSLNGPFTMTYNALIDSVYTQAGTLHGKMKAGENVLKVDANILPLTLVPYGPYTLPMLTVTGTWQNLEGGQGSGTFNAWLVFIPTPDGHVGSILASSFDMTGNWRPEHGDGHGDRD